MIMELQVLEHEHPLKLVDWQLQFPYEEEEEEEEEEEDDDDDDDDADDEGGDPITKEGFPGACERCGEEIHMYQRYYYKCSSCHFSLHSFCAELPSWLDHTSHPHPLLQLQSMPFEYSCSICKSYHRPGKVGYWCLEFECRFNSFILDVKCSVQPERKTIHHPCHQHPLTCVIPKPILCECSACGKEHKGIFYLCTICPGFTIHSECAFLPKTLLIQQTTHKAFSHRHPLTISYSFQRKDQLAKHQPRCRVCGGRFYETWYLWIYKCDKCLYYAHLDCATSRREPFMSIFLPPWKNIKNFEDADHPHLLHLPFPDETYSIPKHLFFQGTITSDDHNKVNLKHVSHKHPLILVDINNNSSLLLMCHDPMKKIQLLCNGCLRPITSTMPFYKCNQNCNFALHEWCTRLPEKIENHPGHPQHTLALKCSNDLPFFFGVFDCKFCRLPCNGFSYCCEECEYYVDVTCGFIPETITHEAHPNHLFSIVGKLDSYQTCHICHCVCLKYQVSFRCNTCDIYLHPECALLLPKETRHKYDKHPMHLSYLPIENHKSEYFCEICEEDLDPHRSFYHCHDCVQSVHPACAPSILQSETETESWYSSRNVHYFMNVKFQGIHNTDRHPHPLSFAQGIVSDGQCSLCNVGLQYKMIFKCLVCKFVIDYDCCDEGFN